MKKVAFLLFLFLLPLGCRPTLPEGPGEPIRTTGQWNDWKRVHPKPVRHLVCGGSGIARLVCYLDAGERLVAVESSDHAARSWPAPYRVAHPEFQNLPVWSNDHGRDQLERLLSLETPPEIILRLDMPGMGIPPEELQRRTGIPTVLLSYGDLLTQRDALFSSLRFLGEVLDKRDRAEEVVAFFEREIAELRRRTADIAERPSVYVGGMSYRGAHGLHSTFRRFPPLCWLNTENVADRLGAGPVRQDGETVHALVPREQLVAWSPEFVFIDMATLALPSGNAVEELHTVPLYRSLDAVENGRVYLLLPNSSYNVNFGSQLANAWFIGSVLYPERFADIDPRAKAKEIFTFLLGDSVLDKIDEQMPGQVFRRISKDTVSAGRFRIWGGHIVKMLRKYCPQRGPTR